MSQQEELFRAFGERANGHERSAVIGAAGNMIVNTIRQNNQTFEAACEELDDLVDRMKAALKARHYTEDGQRTVQNIYVPKFPEIVARALAGQDIN